MLVGPDGQPLPDVIGAPKLEELKPLTPDEMKHIAEPLRQALSAGIDMMSPCNVEFGVMARLAATVLALQAPMPVISRDGEGTET